MKVKKMKEMQAKMNSQNLLMNMVIHDMRTPINCIQMSSENLQSQIELRIAKHESNNFGLLENKVFDFQSLKSKFLGLTKLNLVSEIGKESTKKENNRDEN